MKFRLFDQLDVTQTSAGWDSGPIQVPGTTHVLSETSFATFSLSGSGSDTTGTTGAAANSQFSGSFSHVGIVNFDSYPPIPKDARIHRVVHRYECFVDGDAAANNPPPNVIDCITAIDVRAGVAQVGPIGHNSPQGAHIFGTSAFNGTTQTDIYNPPITYDELVALYGIITLGIRSVCSASSLGNAISPNATSINFVASIVRWSIEVFYTDGPFEFSWNVDSPVPIQSGDEITITTFESPPDPPEEPPNEETLDLTDVDVEIQFDDGADVITIPITVFIEIKWWIIKFIMPDLAPFTPWVIKVIIKGGGKQFEGSIPVAIIPTIFFTNPTGIYTLVPGKTNDTIYIQDDPPNTVDLKIPDPFAKTGFVP